MAQLRLGMVRAATLRRECLEFAVEHLDGIEVGRIFRQVTQCRAHCFDSPANAGPQMDPAVIHHDDVVASERRNQAVFDIGEEHLSGHGTFDHHRGDRFYCDAERPRR